MTAIWHALVAEPRKAVDEHYSAIMKELLKVRGAVPVCLCVRVRPVPGLQRPPSEHAIHRLVTAPPDVCGFLM